MYLCDFPSINKALTFISHDSGMSLKKNPEVPQSWLVRFGNVESELSMMSDRQLEILCIGSEEDSEDYRNMLIESDKLLTDAFDGDLNEAMFESA